MPNEIHCTNIIYVRDISALGRLRVESFVYYMIKKYKDYDIMVLARAINPQQHVRLRKYCPVEIYRGQDIYCKTMIINYDTSVLDHVKEGNVYMTIHADYLQSCYSVYPNFTHPKIKKVLGITQYICDTVKAKFGVECELCYNPLVLEPKQKRIVLVSATRLSAIKGGERMRQLANRLDAEGINYVWYVFTGDKDIIGSPNVCFIKERLNVYKWLQEADYLVQLSDTERLQLFYQRGNGLWNKSYSNTIAIPKRNRHK